MLYPSAKVIIRDPRNDESILLLKRNGYYEPVGGKVEVDFVTKSSESLEQCAIREAREEVGLDIDIEGYVGSYYFFWSIDPHKYSSCAIFAGVIKGYDQSFNTNRDTCELSIEHYWIKRDTILKGELEINPLFVGLDKALMYYCNRY